MEAYVGSVGFSGPVPSQIWTYMPKHIPIQFRQNKKAPSLVARACIKDVSK